MAVSFLALTLSRAGSSLYLTRPNGWYVLRGIEGLDNPPVSLIVDEPATWDGGLVRDVRYAPREVFLPVQLIAADTDTMRSRVRTLAALTDPKRGAVTLTAQHADGTTRTIDGYLSQPFGEATAAGEALHWRRFGLVLTCPDPFWSGAQRSLTFSAGADAEFLSDTYLPVQVNDSQVLGAVTISNEGDADAYAVWTVTGPCDDITVTTGTAEWSVPAGLTDSEVLTVTTTRGAQAVTVNGTPAWGRLAAGAELAPLAPGDNDVTITATATTTASTVRVAWQERWLTVW